MTSAGTQTDDYILESNQMATNFNTRILGFGVYIYRSPSVADPAALFQYMIAINLGVWWWNKSWYIGRKAKK